MKQTSSLQPIKPSRPSLLVQLIYPRPKKVNVLDLSPLRIRLGTKADAPTAARPTLQQVASISLQSQNLYAPLAICLFILGNMGPTKGAAIVSAMSIAGYTLLGLFSLRNEIREKTKYSPSPSTTAPNAKTTNDFLTAFIKSPGMARACSSVMMGALMMSSLLEQSYGVALTYALGFLGAAAAAHIANKETRYWDGKKLPTILSLTFNTAKRLPYSVKSILKDPGISWAVGDNIAAFLKVSLQTMLASPLQLTSCVVGLLCSGIASAPSILRLFGKKVSFAKPEFATLCSGVQCLAFGALNAAQSSYFIAGSFFLFGVTSFCVARAIKKQS